MATSDNEQLITQLIQWKHSYEEEASIPYVFSEEWDAFQNGKWQEYEVLERRRLALDVPRRTWQNEMEEGRAPLDRLRMDRFRPLSAELHGMCPLAFRMAQFDPQYRQNRLYSWASALESWSNFQSLYLSNREFRHRLSPFQRASYRLLKDWWSASYCDPGFPRAAQSYFEARRRMKDTASPVGREELQDAIGAKTSASLYHSSCFNLFLREFHPQTWEPYLCLVYLPLLQSVRYRVSCQALAQRMSFAAVFPRPESDLGFPDVFLNYMPWEDNPNATAHPKYLWDRELMMTVDFDSIPPPVKYICISHTWGRWERKYCPRARIPGVRWKVPRVSKFNVEALPQKLKSLESRYIWIDLFCICQDDSEEKSDEIARQSGIFRGSQGSIAWLNDVTSWKGVKSGLKWLNLKLQRNTMRHHDTSTPEYRAVSDEDLARAAEEAQQDAELCRLESNEREPVSWFSSLWTLQEVILSPGMTVCSNDWTELTDDWGVPIPLHTLMVFLSQSYEMCLTDGPIAESFMDATRYTSALWNHPDRRQWIANMEAWPEAAKQLNLLRVYTRLDNVLVNRSPAVICANANIRLCRDRDRSPAIMSALGVTEWFTSRESSSYSPTVHSTRSRRMRRLTSVFRPSNRVAASVFNMYALEFLRAAHRQFGASFFETTSYSIRLDSRTKTALQKGHRMGTMLPFTRTQGWHSGVTGSPDNSKVLPVEHDSVGTWEIQGDGCVAMRKVGCVFSSSQGGTDTAPPKKFMASILAAGEGRYMNTARLELTDDVVGYVDAIAGRDGVVYAVALYEDCYRQHGVLLYSTRHADEGAAGRNLVKIGIFVAYEWDNVDVREVNWVVL